MKQGRTDRDWAIVAVLTFIAGTVITGALMGTPVKLGPKPIDWPAWFQAVGSVAGIFIAIFVPIWQRQVANRDTRKRERIEKLELAMKFRRALEIFKRNIAKNRPSALEPLAMHEQPISICDMVPNDLKDLLHQTYLVPTVGGNVLTAVNFAEFAQESAPPVPHPRGFAYERWRKQAEHRCELALINVKELLTALSESEE